MEWFMWCDKKNTNLTIFTGWIFKLIIISTQNWPGYAYFDSMNYISVKKRTKIFFHCLIMAKSNDLCNVIEKYKFDHFHGTNFWNYWIEALKINLDGVSLIL